MICWYVASASVPVSQFNTFVSQRKINVTGRRTGSKEDKGSASVSDASRGSEDGSTRRAVGDRLVDADVVRRGASRGDRAIHGPSVRKP